MKYAVLLLTVVSLAYSSSPDGPRIDGSKKLAKANDCNGPVAFSAVASSKGKGSKGSNDVFIFDKTLIDKSIGYSKETGIFTTHCPGLYQFAFSGSGDAKYSLRKRPSSSTTSWHSITSTGNKGGSHIVLLDMEIGEQAAIFHDTGVVGDTNTFSFSGLRVAKK